jgi:integrase
MQTDEALKHVEQLSATGRRDRMSDVRCVAGLLGQECAAIPLDMAMISAGLASISPVVAGITPKRFANIRSGFLAGVRASDLLPAPMDKYPLNRTWQALFDRLSGHRAHIGLSRLARYASREGIDPNDVDDHTISAFIAAVRAGSLHRDPNALHRQVTTIWNECARLPGLGLKTVTVPSFRGPIRRIAWERLPDSLCADLDDYLAWCAVTDPFVPDARSRPLAPRTRRLLRDQIHAAVTALVESGTPPSSITTLGVLVVAAHFKAILRRRLDAAGGKENTFNHDLGKALVQMARTWVKIPASELAELKRLAGKMPVAPIGLTDKNKRFLRQFDDPKTLQRLFKLPDKLWAEAKRDPHPKFRTLARAQGAIAIAILCYIPLRLQNLANLTFETNLFLNPGVDAISSLELSAAEMKNKTAAAYDVPRHITKMLLEYRERLAPKIIGHRPVRLFVNVDGTPKSPSTVAWLIAGYALRHAGVVLTPHQFRHLSAKITLDEHPGGIDLVKQNLVHKSHKTTAGYYAGIDTRRAARHQQRIIDRLLSTPAWQGHRLGRTKKKSSPRQPPKNNRKGRG